MTEALILRMLSANWLVLVPDYFKYEIKSVKFGKCAYKSVYKHRYTNFLKI